MERVKNLDRYQKGILLFLAAMIVIFGVIYAVVTSRMGFLYKDVILQSGTEQGNTTYSGTVEGQDCCFTVTVDKTVTFRCDEKTYGPYTVREDPSAIPEADELSHLMRGIEVKEGGEIIFRGGVHEINGYWMMTNEDGSFAGFDVAAAMSDGTIIGSDGNIVDPLVPSVSEILSLVDGPALTKKGEWGAWFMGIVLSLLVAVSILFADELFRWNLAFQIRNVEDAEPSEWEIATRYIGWGALTLSTLAVYIMGLQ